MSGDMKSEIDEMLKILSDSPQPEAKQEEEEKKEEVPPTEEQKEEPPKDEEKKEEPPAEEKKEEEKEPPVDPKDKEINELRAKIAEFEAKKLDVPKDEPKKEEAKKDEPPPSAQTEIDFVEDLDLDDLSRDPKELNKVLNRTVQEAVRKAVESTLKSIPDVVRNNVEIVNTLREASERFYNTNSDLKEFKKVVAVVFEEIAAANPGDSLEDVMSKAGAEARKRLGLVKKVAEQSGSKKDVPQLPGKGSRSGRPDEKPNTDGLQGELEAMNKSIGR